MHNSDINQNIHLLVKEKNDLEQKEKMYLFFLNQMPQLISYIDKKLTYRFVNKSYEKTFNVKTENIIGKKLSEFLGNNAFQKAKPYINKVFSGNEVTYFEKYHYQNRLIKFMSGHLIPDFNNKGKVTGYYAILEDITHLLRNKIIPKKGNLSLLAQYLEKNYWIADTSLTIHFISTEIQKITGYTEKELTGSKLDKLYHSNTLEKIKEILNNNYPLEIEATIKHKNNEEKWCLLQIDNIYNTQKEVIGIHCLAKDITEKKEYEFALQKSEQRFKSLYYHAPLPYQSLNKNAQIIDVNPAWLNTMGYDKKEEVIGKAFVDFLTIDSKETFRNKFSLFRTNGFIHSIRLNIVRKNGSILTGSFNGNARLDKNNNVLQTYCVFKNVTEEIKVQEALTESEERYRKLVEHAHVGIGILKNYNFLYANPMLLEILDYSIEELNNKTFLSLIHKEDKEYILRKLKLIEENQITPPHHIQFRIIRKDKTIRDISLIISDILLNKKLHYQGIFVDITEKNNLEKNMKQLAAESLFLSDKNKMIIELLQTIQYFSKKYNFSTQDKSKLYKTLNSFSDIEKDWQTIKTHFEVVHKDFFKKLNTLHPSLTQNELRHCAYIKMNFTTKEIARLFNVKDTSIQKARVRLKKKLKLSHKEDLFTFIHSI